MPRYASESELLPRTKRYATPDELEPDEPEYGWMDRAVSTGLRVVPSIVGGVGGGLAGLAAGGIGAPVGAAAGGAAGGGLGEWLAQKYEQARGLREDTNLGSVAVEAGLGAIPLGKSATLLKAGLKGAGMGAAGAIGHGYAEEGEMPDAQTLALSGLLGGAFGAGGEAIGNRLTRKPPAAVDFAPTPRPTMHGPEPVAPGGMRYRETDSGIVGERVPYQSRGFRRYVDEDELIQDDVAASVPPAPETPSLDAFGPAPSARAPLDDLGVEPARARALDEWLTGQRQTRELDDLARELSPGDMRPARYPSLLDELLKQDERRTLRELYEDNQATIAERQRPKPPEGGGAPPTPDFGDEALPQADLTAVGGDVRTWSPERNAKLQADIDAAIKRERSPDEPSLEDLHGRTSQQHVSIYPPTTLDSSLTGRGFREGANDAALAQYAREFEPEQFQAIKAFAERNPRVFSRMTFDPTPASRGLKASFRTSRDPQGGVLSRVVLKKGMGFEDTLQSIEHEARHWVDTRGKDFDAVLKETQKEARIPYERRPSEIAANLVSDVRYAKRAEAAASPLQDLLSPSSSKKKSDVTWSRSEAESAVARGFPGTVDEAEAEIVRRTREPHDALRGAVAEGGEDILTRVAKAGGLNLKDKALSGEVDWLSEFRAEGGRSKAGTLGRVKDVLRRKGKSADHLAELLLGKQATGSDLIEAMADAVRSGGKKTDPSFRPADYADAVGIRPGTRWWDDAPPFVNELTPELVDEPGAAGFISAELASTLGGGLAGGATGATQGDTPQERLQNALLGATAGAAGGYGLTRLLRGRVPAESTSGATTQGASPSAQILRAGELAQQMPPPVFGKARQIDTSAGRVRFVDDKTGDTPLISLPKVAQPYPPQQRQPKVQREEMGLGHFPEEQRATLQELVDQYGLDNLEAQRRGRMPFALQEALSREYVAHGGKKFAPGTNLPAEGHRHIVNTLASVHQKARDLGARISTKGGTDEELLELGKLNSAQEVLFYNYIGLNTEAGRALGQYRLQANVLPTNWRIVKDLLQRGTIRKDLAELSDMLKAIGDDPDGLKTFDLFRNKQTQPLSQRIGSYFSANILSGLQTQERNFLGGAARTFGRLASKPVIGGLDALESMLTGKPRQVYSAEALHEAKGVIAGFDGAIKDALDTFRLGYSRNAMMAGWADVDKLYYPKAEFTGGGKNPLNWIGRGMEGADRFWRSLNQSMELHALTYADARRAAERQGLTGSAYDSFVARQIAEARATPTKDLQRRVNKAAERAVYGEDNVLANHLNALKKHVPALHYVLPFVKTVANIFKQGIEHTPLGFAMQRARSDDLRERAIAHGEAAMGTLALLPIAYYAATGRMSGSGPRDPAQRARLYEEGWRPHSVKMALPDALAASLGASRSDDGEYWVSYALAQPFSIPAAIVANGFEAFDEVSRGAAEKTREQAASDIVTQTLARVGKSALDQSFLSGLGSFVEAINDPERAAEGFFGRTAQGFVPLSGALRNVARVMDPVVRQPEGILESFQSNLPGLSQNVQPRLTRFGEPVVRHDSSALVVPETSPVQRDAISDELARLGVTLALPTDRMSGVDRQLTRDESLQVRQTRGRTVRALLSAVMGAPGYENLPDVARAELLQRALEEVKGDVNQLLRAAVQLQRPDLMQQVSDPVTAAAQRTYR
jgi:hypothetical protein